MKQGPLGLGRRIGQKIFLSIDPKADPQQAWRKLLDEGVEITVTSVKNKEVRLSFRAPLELLVLREELVVPDSGHDSHPQQRT